MASYMVTAMLVGSGLVDRKTISQDLLHCEEKQELTIPEEKPSLGLGRVESQGRNSQDQATHSLQSVEYIWRLHGRRFLSKLLQSLAALTQYRATLPSDSYCFSFEALCEQRRDAFGV